MAHLGVQVVEIAPGRVVLDLPFRADLTQHHGYLHAGILTTVMDSACGYAAFTLMAPGAEVLTVEFKTNFLAPAQGAVLRCTGEVVRSGRTLTVCRGEALSDGRVIAAMQATLMAVPGDG